uniref:Uncharacterized protein n=1 Tax=Rhizophora mucronata TaxID=61149 RepID=A0A2P2IWY1_RHIMU
MLPLSLLAERSSLWRSVKLPSSGGILPDIILEDILKVARFVHFAHVDDKTPDSWLSPRSMKLRLGYMPNVFVISPSRRFSSSRTLISPVQFLRLVGIGPTSLFLLAPR